MFLPCRFLPPAAKTLPYKAKPLKPDHFSTYVGTYWYAIRHTKDTPLPYLLYLRHITIFWCQKSKQQEGAAHDMTAVRTYSYHTYVHPCCGASNKSREKQNQNRNKRYHHEPPRPLASTMYREQRGWGPFLPSEKKKREHLSRHTTKTLDFFVS